MTITKKTLKSTDERRRPKVAYYVRVEAPRDPVTGKRQWLTRQVSTMAEARALETQWKNEVKTGTAVMPRDTTIAELLNQWLEAKRPTVTGNSYVDYEIAIRRHIAPALGSIKVQALTPAHVQAQYATWQADGMSPRMIRRCHLTLSQALAQGVRFGTVARNVCDVVTPPRVDKSRQTVWTPGEVSTFLEVAREDVLAPLWYLLALEGMRRGEALGLRWSDVNWERGAVHVSQTVVADRSSRGEPIIQPRTKTGAGARTIKLTAETLAVLELHRDRQAFLRQRAGDAWQDHDLIVATSHGTPINPNNVTRSYQRLVKAAGVPTIRVHDLRHTAATMLLRAGVPAKIVSERLGHANVGITLDLYSHVVPDMQDAAALAMSEVLKRAQG